VFVRESVGCEHGEDLRRAGHGNEQKRERDQVMRDVDMKETDRRPQILFSTGDVMAQQLVEKRGLDKHDPLRTARMGAYGGGTSLFLHPSLFFHFLLYLNPAPRATKSRW
jgi:hypothetical protein